MRRATFAVPRFSFVFVLLVMLSYNVVAQIDSIIINEKVKNVSLIDFFDSIERKYGLHFCYKPQWFAFDSISEDFNHITVTAMLDSIIGNKPYIYEIIRRNMVIFLPASAYATIVLANSQLRRDFESNQNTILIGDEKNSGRSQMVVLRGSVLNAKTNEPLIGASLQIKNTSKGTTTDFEGKYDMQLTPGYYTILCSNVGFEPVEKNIKIISTGELPIVLVEKSISIKEVTVRANEMNRNVKQNQMSIVELDRKSIKELPALTGQRDVIKGLTLMPGVKSIGEFGSGIHIRGGGEDQNLFLMNGVPIFNTSHVFGLLSVINPDAVSQAQLYKGHIPAEFGERASSVLDIHINESTPEKWSTSGGIGLYNTRLMTEVSVLQKKLTLRVGGRTSYSDWLLHRINDYNLQNSSANFHDLLAQIKFKYQKDHLSLFGYSSYDMFSYNSELDYIYKNMLANAQWTHFFSKNLVSTFTVAQSNYIMQCDNLTNPNLSHRINSDIQYRSIKLNIKYTGLPRHKIVAGSKMIRYDINPGIKYPINNNTLENKFAMAQEQGIETAGYISDIFTICEGWSVNLGLRYSVFSAIGPQDIYIYDEEHPRIHNIVDTSKYDKNERIALYQALEPRASLKIQLNKKSSLKFSYNKNVQYLNLLSHTSISTPDDVWKLSDKYIKPITTNQFAMGYYRNFMNNIFESYIEVYYKNLENIKEYKNNANIRLNDHIETELLHASGRSYGVELFLKKKIGKIYGWISYSWSVSQIRTNGETKETRINENQYYPLNHDKPHDLSIVFNYRPQKRLRLSANFSLSSGRPVTLPEYTYKIGDNKLIYYSERNKYRLPPYHRLDISISLDESLRKKKKWRGSWTFSILNVYARKNAYSVFYKKQKPNETNQYRWFNLYKLYIIGRPFPTLTYSFKF